MKHIFAVAAALLVLPAVAGAQISPNTRLLQKPEWDGAVFANPWVYGQIRYQYYSSNFDPGADKQKIKTSVFGLGPTFAMSIPTLEQLELGGRAWFLSSSTKNGGRSTGTGLSDVDIWGKYQFIDDPILLAGGLLFTLPTGTEKVVSLGAGEINVEFFGATRYYITDVFALVGHLGLRSNGDAKKKTKDAEYDLDGQASFELGGGLIYQAIPEMNILAELNFATEPYKDLDNDIEITAGVEYSLMDNFNLRGGFGIGLDDVSPDFELMAGASYAF